MIVPFRLKEGKFIFYETQNHNRVFEHLKYDVIKPFSNGYSIVKNGDKYGAVDENGLLVIPVIYDYLATPSEDHLLFSLRNKYGIIGNQGNLVIPPIYEFLSSVHNGLIRFSQQEDLYADFRVSDNVEYGYLDINNNIAINPNYIGALDFSENLARVGCYLGLDEDYNSIIKFGYINKMGDTVIDCNYDWAESFRDGVAYVIQGKKEFYINHEGNRVPPPLKIKETENEIFYQDFAVQTVFGEGNIRLYGFKNNSGQIVIEPKYDEVSEFQNGLASVFLKNQTFYILPDGRELREL